MTLSGEWGALIMAIVAGSRLESLSLAAHLVIVSFIFVVQGLVLDRPVAKRFLTNLVSAEVGVWITQLTRQDRPTIPVQLSFLAFLYVVWARLSQVASPGPIVIGAVTSVSFSASATLVTLATRNRLTPGALSVALVAVVAVWSLYHSLSHALPKIRGAESLFWRPIAIIAVYVLWPKDVTFDMTFIAVVVLGAVATVSRLNAGIVIMETIAAIQTSRGFFGRGIFILLAAASVSRLIKAPFAETLFDTLYRTIIIQIVLLVIKGLSGATSIVLLSAIASIALE